MKLKNKTTLLAAAIALAGVSYLPSASAALFTTTTNLGTIAADDSAVFLSGPLQVGSHVNWYDFQVDVISNLVATGNSLKIGASKGFALTSFNLHEGTHVGAPLATGTITSTSLGTSTSYAALDLYTPLQTNHWYSFEVKGDAFKNGANYSASLSTISAVPLPGAVWMMLTGIIGLFGYQARNKKTA